MNRLITSVLVSIAGFNALMTAQEARPRLVVNIVVDQLRTADLEYLESLFGPDGFKRLMKDGAYLRDVDFNTHNPDIANSSAILMTGSVPSANGVPGATIFDSTSKRMVPVLTGSDSRTLSPEAIRLSTFCDEIAINGNGLSLIYSISADPQQSVILAGHAANSAVWIDENTGRWASSSYYKEIPQCVSERNHRASLTSRIDTMTWRPMLDVSRYRNISAAQKERPFRYSFRKSDRDVYSRFSLSPLANREVTDLAISYLNTLRLGTRYSDDARKSAMLGEPVDVLNIGYRLNPAPLTSSADYSLEQQDAYVRLDKQLSRLFDAIDHSAGLDNTLVVLSSTGYYDSPAVDNSKYRIPSGDFSARRAVSLANAYLSAKYGNGDYIDTFVDGQLYLNNKELESRHINREDAAAELCAFLLKMSGVNGAYTAKDLNAAATSATLSLSRDIDPKHCGDVFVSFTPGWNISDDMTYPARVKTASTAVTVAPTFFLGPQIEPSVISTTVDATRIAPTITQILRIRSPNGAVSRPLLLF